MSSLTDRIARMVADAIAGEDVADELTAISSTVEALEYRDVMSRQSLAARRPMQTEYDAAASGR